MISIRISLSILDRQYFKSYLRSISSGCQNIKDRDLTSAIKHQIEKCWKNDPSLITKFDNNSSRPKYYVLSMFPYPSGYLHMGHVRVYTISDTMARFYKMNGKNVLHPMGWDSFGLPAENAALQRNIPAGVWTDYNIDHMKEQLQKLGCSFDWSRELSTSGADYYKWTQFLFLQLFKNGLAYQKEALVNWDPVDKTVLADEQVDSNGCSWRSGAKVEKKLLRQWFIKTTKFAKQLYDGLDDPTLEDWKDIIKLQKHWIGLCDGYSFDLAIHSFDREIKPILAALNIWTKEPELLNKAAFIAIRKSHILNDGHFVGNLNLFAFNPFTNKNLPLIVTDDVEYDLGCDAYLGVPSVNDVDEMIANQYGIDTQIKSTDIYSDRNSILQKAHELNIGGHPVSSKLKDWLISRQRQWGTPIPIIHCNSCGPVPVELSDLPVNFSILKQKAAICPKCSSLQAIPETDTMDTFVDSSWYFLRFLDARNPDEMFDKNLAYKFMPVDLYIGGKEHAVLHLYYARFMNHFLHFLGLVPEPEPFKRLLVQGMVMGKTFRVKGTGKYIKENEVDVIDAKKNKALQKITGDPVVIAWEKMSKSKMNGVDPSNVLAEYGCDTTRLIILGDVAPTSHRNWCTSTFPGILNWQKRIWMTVHDFCQYRLELYDPVMRPNSKEFLENDYKLCDARNYYIKGVTFHYKYSHQLSVAISKMQGLTNSIRRASKDVMLFGKHYELALATQIIMLAPMAPHFSSELWSRFVRTPHRLNENSTNILWDHHVLQQTWPEVDMDYELDLTIKVNGFENSVLKYPRSKIDLMTQKEALDIAFEQKSVTDFINSKKIKGVKFELYPGCDAILNIFLERSEKIKNL